MSSQSVAESSNQSLAPASTSTMATSHSKHPPWTELLYEVHKHIHGLAKDITRNQRMCDGCANLIKATKDPVRQKHVAVTKTFAESTLQTLRLKLTRLNGAIHRAVYEGLKTQLNHTDSIRRPEQLLTPSKRWKCRQRAGTVELTLPMVALPWRTKARSVDWKSQLSRELQEHYRENPARFSAVFDELKTAYTKAACFSVRENRITQCIAYYHHLCQIERRFFRQGHMHGVSFAWFDPLSGAEVVTHHISAEKFTALYNAAAVCTQVAAFYENQNASGVKRACRLYEQAAGLLTFILDCGLALDEECTEDSTNVGELKQTVRILRDIQLAQAQESLWRCMQQPDASSHNHILSEEAACVALTYSELVDLISSAQHPAWYPTEWLTIAKAKVSFFNAIAEYHAWLEARRRAQAVLDASAPAHDTRRLERALALLQEAEDICMTDNKYAQLAGFVDMIGQQRRTIQGDIEDTMLVERSSDVSSSDSLDSLTDIQPLTSHWAEASRKLLETCRPQDLFQQLGPLQFFNAQQPIRYRETLTVAKKDDDSLGFTLIGQHPTCIDTVDADSPAGMGGLLADSFLLTVNGVDVRGAKQEDVQRTLEGVESPLRLTVVRTCLDPHLDEKYSHASTNHGSQAYSCQQSTVDGK
ncbi:hypothetical protein PTSG_01088 [Salpingoeca rosetta]|uniref:PDZ domain-containing protein n=1 Tax=Salpingoeca rosetta (strain ATCC 50818 / BSB-021) TaxID=946362 RepID=F2U0S2_SALR5|nr:uncharacterized protein PTSG_01088 [Salpingoeca rosetta]EGD80496.1 hypothetical protein PTSG_01088 [Salpingoeca rosetta]|eukprot:XP_004997057.1 hypothetical protein PTSG_01088 [Salpingoeca rosetta]